MGLQTSVEYGETNADHAVDRRTRPTRGILAHTGAADQTRATAGAR
jgi:hypothetical protein